MLVEMNLQLCSSLLRSSKMTYPGTIKNQYLSMDWKWPLIWGNAIFWCIMLKLILLLSSIGMSLKNLCKILCITINCSDTLPFESGKSGFSVFMNVPILFSPQWGSKYKLALSDTWSKCFPHSYLWMS